MVHQGLMCAFWSFMSEPIYSLGLVKASLFIGPFRKSPPRHGAESLATWTALGYRVDTRDF
jgi:hypothetical protein